MVGSSSLNLSPSGAKSGEIFPQARISSHPPRQDGQNGHLSRRRDGATQEYRPDPPARRGRLCRHAQGLRPHRALPRRAGGDRRAGRHHRGHRPFRLRLRHGPRRAAGDAQLSRLHEVVSCTSINHVVCHGIPDDKPLQRRRHRQHRRHLHPRRLARQFQPHVSGRRRSSAPPSGCSRSPTNA